MFSILDLYKSLCIIGTSYKRILEHCVPYYTLYIFSPHRSFRMPQVQKKVFFVFLFGFPMTDGSRCSFGCDKNKVMIEERESREREASGGHSRMENTQNGTRGKVGLRLPASDARSGERVFIRECGKDKYSYVIGE